MAGKKHGDGAKTGSKKQPPGTHRGPETGNGYTASTGHGKPKGVVFKIVEAFKPGGKST